jgi:hypothetical protein
MPMHAYFDEAEGRVLSVELAPDYGGLYKMTVQVPVFLARRYPTLKVQSAMSTSNEVSAGGPSVLDIFPNSATAGTDLAVKVRGLNLSPGAALQIGSETVPAMVIGDDSIQTIAATIPGRLLRAGALSIMVVDPEAAVEAPSNAVWLTVTQ